LLGIRQYVADDFAYVNAI